MLFAFSIQHYNILYIPYKTILLKLNSLFSACDMHQKFIRTLKMLFHINYFMVIWVWWPISVIHFGRFREISHGTRTRSYMFMHYVIIIHLQGSIELKKDNLMGERERGRRTAPHCTSYHLNNTNSHAIYCVSLHT